MTRRALIPPFAAGRVDVVGFSPGLIAGGFAFITGMTGSDPEGRVPDHPETQFRAAFDKIEAVLREGGMTCADVVEMTSYHIDIKTHFETFARVRRAYVADPFPAWTAIGVAELRRTGALVEVKVIAQVPPEA